MNYKILLPIVLLALAACQGGKNECGETCGQDSTQKYYDNEAKRMEDAKTQADKDKLKVLLQINDLYSQPKTTAVDQYRVYVDGAESLKEKFDKYNADIDKNRRNYKDAVDIGESIIYSNISTSLPQGYTSEGIFVPESVNSNISPSPFAKFKPSNAITTPEGQFVRRMANQYQAYWGENYFYIKRSFNDSSQFYLGASYVKLADEKFKSSHMDSIAYLKAAQAVLNSL